MQLLVLRPADDFGFGVHVADFEAEEELEEQVVDGRDDGLLILRPSEVYGGGGSEGIDKFISAARKLRVVPLLFGDARLQFAPLHVDDFGRATCELLAERRQGVQVIEMCGPESLSGAQVARRIGRRFKALPLPLWRPALAFTLRALRRVGLNAVAPDQLERLTGPKTASRPTPDPALDAPAIRFMLD